MDIAEYNRIILVGNGLDKAMGHKTSYEDFLFCLLKSSIKASIDSPVQNDLFKITAPNVPPIDVFMRLQKAANLEEILACCDEWNCLSVSSQILRHILSSWKSGNWVDIENLYFHLLIETVEKIKLSKPINRNFANAYSLNHEMDLLTAELENYLHSIENKRVAESSAVKNEWLDFQDALCSSLNLEEGYIAHGNESLSHNYTPRRILYLNFNYTPFLMRKIQPFSDRLHHHILHIHGQIKSSKNPIIFGYGDDSHDYYSQLEVENNDEILRLFKAFHYPKTANYHTLLNFMAERDFEVFVVGHSCGLSDRTLLKTIFEDSRCKAIKIFHRGSIEGHFKKTIAISRHFSKKASLRRKILHFDRYAIIPQIV